MYKAQTMACVFSCFISFLLFKIKKAKMDNLGTHVSPGVYVSEKQKTYQKRKNNIERKQGTVIPTPPGPLPPDPYPQHEYVDLGLHSGTLWATTNIQDEYGNDLYFAWGETQGYTGEQVGVDKNFGFEDYKFRDIRAGGSGYTKYNLADGLMILEDEDDAAAVNWGSGWRMPSMSEAEELQSNTTSAITQRGIVLTSMINGNKLSIPFSTIFMNGMGALDLFSYCCWTAELNPIAETQVGRKLSYLLTNKDDMPATLRFAGCMVRPVRNA